MDYYLIQDNALNRLREEYNKFGKLIIAYDFDDTIYDFHNKGRKYDKVIDLLRRWKDNAYFIIYTASEESRYREIESYVRDNNIPFNSINENIRGLNIPKGKKLYYNIFLDDRAGLDSTYNILNKLAEEIGLQ